VGVPVRDPVLDEKSTVRASDGGNSDADGGDTYRGVGIPDAHQREQLRLVRARLAAEPHARDRFGVLNGDNVADAVIERQWVPDVDAALSIEHVSVAEAKMTGVMQNDAHGRVERIDEKPDDPESTRVSNNSVTDSSVLLESSGRIE